MEKTLLTVGKENVRSNQNQLSKRGKTKSVFNPRVPRDTVLRPLSKTRPACRKPNAEMVPIVIDELEKIKRPKEVKRTFNYLGEQALIPISLDALRNSLHFGRK